MDRECTCEQGLGVEAGQKERENPKTETLGWDGAPRGVLSHAPEIMTWTEIKSQMLNWLSHLGPRKLCFKGIRGTKLGQSREDKQEKMLA